MANVKTVRNGLMLFLISLFFVFAAPLLDAHHTNVEVAVFTTREKSDVFWSLFVEFMQKAADDLGITLKPHYAHGNGILMANQIEAAAKAGADFLVFPNFKGSARTFMNIAEKYETPFLLVNQGLAEGGIGNPREKYKYWMGELLPDDEDAGFQLANTLLDQAAKLKGSSPKKRLEVIGIAGIISDWASIERENGLKRAIKNREDVILKQVVHANWKKEDAMVSFRLLKMRYPDVDVVWVASDLMALGVLEQAKMMGLQVNHDFVTGGIDWSRKGIESVLDGGLNVSIGGHFMDGAWALVMIYDYLHGSDFKSNNLRIRSKMQPITQVNATDYQKSISLWKENELNFITFSKTQNPTQQSYNFSINQVLEMVKHF